jgi:Eukaryotic aspartyl protease
MKKNIGRWPDAKGSRPLSKATIQRSTVPNIARIPITNVYMEGDYTGIVKIGTSEKPLNVILDTGSSALAVDAKKYSPSAGDQTTDLAQTDSYGDGSSWTGAVIQTTLTIGDGDSQIPLPNANAAIAYQASANMFAGADGILGLAYAPLDDAFEMASNTWKNQYSATQVRTGKAQPIAPYLTQLATAAVASDKIAFYTLRSAIHVGTGNDAVDPLNNGFVIVGGGEESTDLYTGAFQSVKVLNDSWYSTNLKQVIVGTSSPIAARIQGPQGMPTNSIIDSGTNSLNFSQQLLNAILAQFAATQRPVLKSAILGQELVPIAELGSLDSWPTISFVLEGDAGDVKLDVPSSNYWQVDAGQAGYAAAAITVGEPGLAILGLPLMNGYFTIFDGEADGGKGAVRFATIKK